MGNIPRDEGYVIAFWLATLLFGAHTVVFALFVWITVRLSPTAPTHRMTIHLAFTATAMLIVGAVNNIVVLQRVITAFWGNTGQTAAEFLNETNVTSNFIESTTWFLQVTLGDAFMTYRCWILYGRRWWALGPPLAMVLGTFTMGIMLQVEYSRPHPAAVNYERTQDLFRWEASMMAMTVVLNLGLTLAIAGRILWKYRLMSSAMAGRKQERHEYIVWLIVESGMIIAVAQTLVIILAAIGSAGYQIVVHAVNPLIGIVFTGVIVRVQMASFEYNSTELCPPLDTIILSGSMIDHYEQRNTTQHRLISFEPKPEGSIQAEVGHKPP